MKLSEPVRDALQRLIRMGLDSGLARLAHLTGAPWEAVGVSVRAGSADELRQRSPAPDQGHCGAFFSMPGGVFVVSFPDASVAAVTQAFFRGFSKKAEAWKGKEPDAVAEISNMVVNPVANVLGDTALMTIFLSSPQVERGDWGELDAKAFAGLALGEDKDVLRADVRLESGPLSSSCAMVILLNSALAGRFCEALAG
jgi:chemotaxis protein CheY-P-specific phosphatase CheC